MNKIIDITFAISILSLSATALYVASQYQFNKPKQSPPSLTQPEFIKDPVTRCQYISANGAMYPRLDAKRTHICSDLPIYKFNSEESPS